MSKWYTQVTYECRCSEPYGSECDQKSRFVLKHNCSYDFTTIYIRRHIDENDKYIIYQLPECITDYEKGALQKLLSEQPYNDKFVREGEEIDEVFLSQKEFK